MSRSESSPNGWDPKDARLATPKELAGSHYEEMTRSKEAAMAFLSTADLRICLGAIMVCEQNWQAAREPSVLEACRSLAVSNADDSIRLVALRVLGEALSSSRDRNASKFVAQIVLDSQNSTELRTGAYWVLREIQYGIGDVDFDTHMLGTIHTVKECLKLLPGKFSEETVKSNLLPKGSFPDDFWDSANRIDWEFVHRVYAQ